MKNKNDLIWCFSLMIISVATIILAGSNIMGLKLPYIAVRIIGIADLIALPVLVCTSVKKFGSKLPFIGRLNPR